MNKTDCRRIALETGAMQVYDFDGIRLHAYQTNDPLTNEVFVVEKDGRGLVIEYPCFFDNIKELETYLAEAGITVEGIVAAYHMAGASFLAGTPVYATKEADAYGHVGGGKTLIDNFTQVFGDAFDSSIPQVTNIIEGSGLMLAGIELRILRNSEAFDIEIPGINAAYLHMLGHDCHSIVGGPAHADALVLQLQELLDKGIELVLTSHYTPEDLKDVRTKIAYVQDLPRIAGTSSSAEDFKCAVEQKHPGYSGQNYLDMTASAFFGA